MSVIPMILNGAFDDFFRPTCAIDPDFQIGLFADDFIRPRAVVHVPRTKNCCRTHRRSQIRAPETSDVVASNEKEFKVNLNVRDYSPENLTVKIVDNTVTIDGKHEERKDEHGFVSRQFTRRYVLPEDVDTGNIVSRLSAEGVLSITAPKKTPQLLPNGRIIPIQHSSQNGKTAENTPNTDQDKMEQ